MKPLRVFILLASVAGLLAGCCPHYASTDEPSEATTRQATLGVEEVERPRSVDWRFLLPRGREQLAEMYKLAVDEAWERVRANLTEEERVRVPADALEFRTTSTPFEFFALSSATTDRPRVVVTLGGARTVHMVCEAMAIHSQMLIPRQPKETFFGLYCASMALSTSVLDITPPEQALGWQAADIPDAVREAAADQLIETLYFIVAHEVGHMLLKHPGCSPFETDLDRLAESRFRESEADQFAFRLLYRMGKFGVPAAQMFLAWTVCIEGLHPVPGRGTHPTQMSRITAAADFAAALAETRRAPEAVRVEIQHLRFQLYKFALAVEDPELRGAMAANVRELRMESLRRPRPVAATAPAPRQ